MLKIFRRRKQTPPPQPAREPERQKPGAIEINGRRYFTEVPYALPKDTQEIHRLDFQHYLLRQALKSNYLAPIGSAPATILDVGCGTGRWGKEIAFQFPQAEITCLDLEESKTSTGPIPPNYHFVQGNILERLPFDDQTFDFVHQRLLVAAIPAARWPDVIRELLRVTRDRGYLELVECGVEIHPSGPRTRQFFQKGIEASLVRGIDARLMPSLGTLLREAGLSRVNERAVDIPIGNWGGRIGVMMKEDLSSGLEGLRALYAQHGWEEHFEDRLQELPYEWEACCSSFRFFIFYGCKAVHPWF